MHPYMFLGNYLTPSQPYKGNYRQRKSAVVTLRQWLQSAARQWERRKMIAALEAMDDRLLRDIGIYRKDIPRVVDGLDDREIRMRPLAAASKPEEIFDDIHRKAA